MRFKILLLLLTACCLTICFHFCLGYPLKVQYQSANTELKKLKKILERQDRVFKEKAVLEIQNRMLQKDYAARLVKLPNQENLPALLADLHQKAMESRLYLRISSPGLKKKGHFLTRQSIDIHLTGSFEGLTLFFKKVEAMDYPLAFHDFFIKKRKTAMEMQVKASIYQNSNKDNAVNSVHAKPLNASVEDKNANHLFTLNSLGYMGFIQDETRLWGLVKIPSGQIINLEQGEYLGRERGVIRKILPESIEVALAGGELFYIRKK